MGLGKTGQPLASHSQASDAFNQCKLSVGSSGQYPFMALFSFSRAGLRMGGDFTGGPVVKTLRIHCRVV